MVASIIGTSACIWCGEPVALRKGLKYTRFCQTPRCRKLNEHTVASYTGAMQLRDAKSKLRNCMRVVLESRRIATTPNLYTAVQLYLWITHKYALSRHGVNVKKILESV